MDEIDLIQETDAKVWAQEFMRRFGGWKRIRIDEELMHSWFASCFMSGYDKGRGALAVCGDELAYKLGLDIANSESKEGKL